MNDCLSFNADWRFHLGVPEGGETHRHFWKAGYTLGPGARVYNDTAWRTVTLPHDWGAELEYDYTVDVHHGASPIANGREKHSVGFYRKRFFVSEEWQNLSVSLAFDGVYRDCEIWVNGEYVTRNVSGYVGFTVELDDLLIYGELNTVALRVDASYTEGWFYEGAGIYRDVQLRLLPRIHADVGTAFVRLDNEEEIVLADFDAVNDTDKAVRVPCALTVDGKTVRTEIDVPARQKAAVRLRLPFAGYHPWDIDDPFLYDAVLTVGEHAYTVRTGFRRFRFDADHGFFLNGKPVKLLGSCTHQDFAVVGSALNDDTQRYKMRVLKKYGFNASRTAHNPPADATLDACDEVGIVVMAETRLFGSTPEALSQLRRMILSGRNHPSVILWSIGNEEIIQNTDSGYRQARRAVDLAHRLDPTRPNTYGGNNADALTGINAAVDVRGVNYLNISRDLSMVDRYHRTMPHLPIVGSEESSTLASRSVWTNDPRRGHLENFDNCGVGYTLGAEALWIEYMRREYLAGAFVWTGFDYRGEATKQAQITNFGVIDLCGFPKTTAHYYRAMGNPEPYLFLYPDWNRAVPTGTPVEIIVYTNATTVVLFVNGKSYGRQSRAPYASLRFTVPYESGTVTAVGYDAAGTETVRAELATCGAPTTLCAETERIGNTVFVRLSCADADGIPCERACDRLTFTTSGAKLIGAANGDPSDPDPELVQYAPKTLPLRGFRVYESDGAYQYSDQTLADVLGQTDPDKRHKHAVRFADETDAQLAQHSGPRRKLPVQTPQTDAYLEIFCNFWLDDTAWDDLRIGYVTGRPEITLNGADLTPKASLRPSGSAGDAASMRSLATFDGDGDALCVPVGDALKRGENTLCLVVRPSSLGTYAVGRGIFLCAAPVGTLVKRLWNGHALCMVDAPDGGTLTVCAGGMEPVTVRL